jgi:hypothetical protein
MLRLGDTPEIVTRDAFKVPVFIFAALRFAIFASSIAALPILAFAIEPFFIKASAI